ncbi:MAG: translation initiation factor IF-2 [Opitutae bacterium]|nr:translation initiation factor IF-2 [Opitutae bacterium]
MSFRVHAIAKEVGMTSKELVALLVERGYEIKSASSSIDNITAESLIEELKPAEAEVVEVEESEVAKPETDDKPEESADEEPASDDSTVAVPIVKSKQDIDRERLEKQEAEDRAKEASSPAVSPDASELPSDSGAVPLAPPPPAPIAPSPPKPSAIMAPPPPSTGKSTEPATSEDAPDDATVAPTSSDSKILLIKPPIVVREFAVLIGLKPFQLISELMEMGIFASMNQSIEEDVAQQLASSKGFELDIRHRGEKAETTKQKEQQARKVDEDDESLLEPRSPVVCILGHVDHGKTTLLDTIRKANVVSGEAGGITQHVGAYQIEHNGQKITFLDTPGHAAFSKIRERGANLTDISILVVAADDGFMPQTDEALKFAQRAQGSIVVAINKTDVKGADIDKVKTHMQERGIPSEDWGGETVTVAISALKGENIEDLLDMILLQSEVMELKANPNAVAEGVVVEARQEVGRGATATVIVQKGTLKTGDVIVCGSVYCKVKAMLDDRGEQVKTAPPSTPVNILGWSDAPHSGDIFRKVKNDREARNLADDAIRDAKSKSVSVPVAAAVGDEEEEVSGVDALFAAIAKTKANAYRVILRADVRGSVEALKSSLEEIKSDKITLEVVQSEVGQITKNDISMASMSKADVIGFNAKMENGVMGEAKHHGVNVFQNNIIYELIDLVKENMADLLDAELVEKKTGRAEVREVFRISKGRDVAGSMVMEGSITRNAAARLLRGGEVIAEGKIDTLKRFKDDATEVKAGFECGIRLEGSIKYEEGDAIETYEIEKIRPSL